MARRGHRRSVCTGDCKPVCCFSGDSAMPALSLVTLLIALLTRHALGHGISDVDPGSLWSYDPWLLTPLYVVGIAFYAGTQRLWRSAGGGRGVSYRQVAAFWCGWLIAALAVTSPLHWLGERLFTAHMIEHELLMVLAAPLMAFARINGPMWWSLPATLSPRAGRFLKQPPQTAARTNNSQPVSATALHAAALWSWHAPPLYTWALQNPMVHRLQHISFFATALLFWWVLFHGRGQGRSTRLRDGIAIACLFVTVLHSGVLGAALTLSSRTWIPDQDALAGEFGLSPLEDQQLANNQKRKPKRTHNTAAALFFAYRWLTLIDTR